MTIPLLFQLLVEQYSFTEDAFEDSGNIVEATVHVECAGDAFGRQQAGDLRIGCYEFLEDQVFFPGLHGECLNCLVSVFAEHAGFCEVEQELAGEDEAAGEVQVLQHALGVDHELVDEVGGLAEQVVGEGGGVRQDDALGRGVRNITLVPEGNIFKCYLRVCAHHTSKAADVLAGDGVALVGHGAGALLLFAEELFRFADFGALQMADFRADLVERRRDDGERADVRGVAVALKYLCADFGGLEAEALADFFFQLRCDGAVAADCAGELADAHVFCCGGKACDVALTLGVPEEQFEAEGGGFCMDAVRAADAGGERELDGAALEYVRERVQAFKDGCGGLLEQEGLCGVHNVSGGEAEVQPARLRADLFCDGSGEGDDVVACLEFDLLNARDFEVALGTDGLGGFLGDDACVGEDFACGRFDFKPCTELRFIGPELAHGGACIAIDQGNVPLWRGGRDKCGLYARYH